MTDPAVPAPGPDTPTWTIDDDLDVRPLYRNDKGHILAELEVFPNEEFVLNADAVRWDAIDALVADVRAARAHEHCGPATDTLRQARELAVVASNGDLDIMVQHQAGDALFDLLVDGGTDG